MEQTVRRRRRRKNQSRQGLLILIGILTVLLVVVIIVALSLDSGTEQPENTTPENSGTSQNTTPSTGPIVIQDLTLTAPVQTSFISLEPQVEFRGTADPRESLTVNGIEVTKADDGSFAYTVALRSGENEITLAYRDETVTYHIEYRYALQYFSPGTDTRYGCGATVQLAAAIRKGASLTVTLGGQQITMKEAGDQLGSGLAKGFVLYTGTYKLPNNNTEDLDLGPITYTATCDGVTETYQSGNIICQKSADVLKSDPSVTPSGGQYMDVGSGYIVEILTNSAETFLGSGTGDKSSPTMNYLPKGTVDYGYVEDITNNAYTIRLRCGRRIYRTKNNYPDSGTVKVYDAYQGTLPDHNEVGIASLQQSGSHTVLAFDVLWNAPFYLDLLPQDYRNPSQQDYRIESLTATYVDITFCYATVFEGTVQIPGDNPLFSRAELTQNESDCTLRLYLKKAGGFYGWDSYYNEAGQLCFRFLNPARVTTTDANSYGVDLTGVRIMLDVGHGGLDGGTFTHDPSGRMVDEAELNLNLAFKVKAELESMGATVIMNREDDSSINVLERIAFLKEQAPDLCLAIHQNALEGYPNHSGCEVCYSTPFSQLPAKLIYQQTQATGIYNNYSLDWHVYYVARETTCPVVLTENGFITSTKDFANMQDDAVLTQKAQAMARGIAEYFLEINK